MSNSRYTPAFQVEIGGTPIPAALRSSITGVRFETSLEGADRVELSLANENLRWLDHPLLSLDNTLILSLGYAPDPLQQVFVGEIVGQSPTFPGSGAPLLTITAQDRRTRLQKGTAVRWFAINVSCQGNYPLPDLAIASMVAAENLLIPVIDPVSAALAVLIGEIDTVINIGDREELQKIIRKQQGENHYDFLKRIAAENGWEMLIDHSDPLGGQKLRFISPLAHLTPDLTLKYGQSLIEFTPRISTVGQIAAVSVKIWRPEMKMDFTVTVDWDWDRQSLSLSISAGSGIKSSASNKNEESSVLLLEEPVNHMTAPRLIVNKLINRLNQRLTGSGSTIGDLRIQPGGVVRIEGIGEQFGGLYRIVSVTHTLDSSGFRTSFEVRKEIWFGSIPLPQQGATRIIVQQQPLAVS